MWSDAADKFPYLSLIRGTIRRETLFLPMRRLYFILLFAGILAPAALAAPTAAGDGTIAGLDINGNVTISARGAVWGQIDNGTITVVDRDSSDGPAPRVSGYTTKAAGSVPGSTVYSGQNLHFQVGGGGRYRLGLHGTNIDFTAVGTGKARLEGWLGPAPGKFAVGDEDWQPMPYTSEWVSFPDNTVTASSGP